MGEAMPFSVVLQVVLSLFGPPPPVRDCAAPRVVPFVTYTIPSASMQPTLPRGSWMAAVCRADSRPIGRGDVVTFDLAGRVPPVIYVKRVVGLPGDRVSLRGGVVWLNDVPATYRQAPVFASGASPIGAPRLETLPGGASYEILQGDGTASVDNTPEVVVPPGQLFVLGDNRENSLDSRFTPVGFVALDQVVARAVLSVSPQTDPLGLVFTSITPLP